MTGIEMVLYLASIGVAIKEEEMKLVFQQCSDSMQDLICSFESLSKNSDKSVLDKIVESISHVSMP